MKLSFEMKRFGEPKLELIYQLDTIASARDSRISQRAFGGPQADTRYDLKSVV